MLEKKHKTAKIANQTSGSNLGRALAMFVFIAPSMAFAQELDSVTIANYEKCIKIELVAAKNDDGTIDEEFFAEGQAHCDKALKLDIRIATANTKISKITSQLVAAAKKDLGLK